MSFYQSEFPFDGSWGYQPIGLYSPTSRFGTAEGFKRLVNKAHKAESIVILDWVPVISQAIHTV